MLNGLQLFLDELNQAGAIDDRALELELRVLDDGNDPQRAVQAAQQLADDASLLAVVGHQYSSVALAAGEVYDRERLPLVSPSASNSRVTRQSPWVFSMNYSDHQQGEFIALYLQTILRADSALLIYSDDAYGDGLRQSFSDKAGRIGLRIDQQIAVDPDQPNGQDEKLRVALSHAPSAVALLTHAEEGAQLVRQVRRLAAAPKSLPIIGPDAFNKASFIDALDGDSNSSDVFIVGPFSYRLASLAAKRFVDRYRQRFGVSPTLWSAFAYDAARLIADAIAAADGDADRSGVRDYLAARRSSAQSVSGVTGNLFFDEHGAMRRNAVVSVIDRGEFRPAYTQLRSAEEQLADDPNRRREMVAAGEISVVDSEAYYRTQVVYAGVDFYRINNVDIAAQRFDVELFLWLKWAGELDPDGVGFLNAIFSEENQREVLREGRRGDLNYVAYKIKTAFVNPFDMRHFPFDTQILPMRLAHNTKQAARLLLVADQDRLSRAELRQIYPEEWRYVGRADYAGTYRENSTFGDPDYDAGAVPGTEFSVYQSDIIIERILLPYLLTLFLPLTLLLLITLLLFLIPVEQFDARITIVMTALLSVLVFHLAQGDSLPNVGYLIKADLYFLITYILMFALIFNTVIVNRISHAGRSAAATRVNQVFSWLFVPVAAAAFGALTVLSL